MVVQRKPLVAEPSAALSERIDSEIAELANLLLTLEGAVARAREEQGQAEVIRRHVARNPEKFSPHERENVFRRAQALAERRVGLQASLEGARGRLELLQEVRPLLAGPRPEAAVLEIHQAVEAERLRIARDLHDGPAQVLSNLVLEAEILERLLHRDPKLVPAELEEFKASVRNAVGDMRRFMFDLRPTSLDDLGLVATLKRYTTEYQDRTGIVCRFNVSGEEKRLPTDIEEALYRIIQEALTNVQRHAGAKTVEVALIVQAGTASLRVRDDGA
ncbi:MAG: sensor histidine kinase, partial [Candidatus Dormibacteraceae bacterium]